MPTFTFDLKLAGGKVVQWEGADGPDAARRYAAEHPGVAVIATRYSERVGLFVGLLRIVEPGERT